MIEALPIRGAEGGLLVELRVTPNGGGNRIDGLARDASGRQFLKVRVSAAPEKGKANAAVIKLLAREWGLPKSACAIVSGELDRNKVLSISGDGAKLQVVIAAWFDKHGFGLKQADGDE